jgi:hypothetical protein
MTERNRSRHRQEWKGHVKGPLDALDVAILECVSNYPGTSMTEIFNCIGGELISNLSTVSYRIKTLEKAGHLVTRAKAQKILCYPVKEVKT